MKNQDKYPDTPTFSYLNVNPKSKLTSDCVVRAVSLATGMTYADTLLKLVDVQLSTGYAINSNQAYDKLLTALGWTKHKQPRKADNTKYTGKEFCKQIADPHIKYVAHIGGHHIVAIISGKVNDTWDSTSGCIGNYWTKG